MDTPEFTTVEVHRVKNGWMVHPTRGWLEENDHASRMWDDRIWVFNNAEDLFAWLSKMQPQPPA